MLHADLRSETLKLPMSLLLVVPSVMATAEKLDWRISSKHCIQSRAANEKKSLALCKQESETH